MLGRWLVGGLAAAMLIGSPPLGAQRQRPLTPLPPNGLRVAPFFDGWYRNPDGTSEEANEFTFVDPGWILHFSIKDR